MKTEDLELHIAAYSRAVLEDVPMVDPDELASPVRAEGAGPPPARRVATRVPGWAMAVGVMSAVLAVGAAAALLTLPGDAEDAGTTMAAPAPPAALVPVEPVVVDTPLGAMQWTFRSERSPIEHGLVEWQGRLIGLDPVRRSLQSTTDGRSWAFAGSLPDVHSPISIASYDGYLYLIDSRTRMPEGYLIRHPSVWRSADLRTWESVPVARQTPSDYLGEIEVVASDTGILIVAPEFSIGSTDDPPALSWLLTDLGFRAGDVPSGALVDRAGLTTLAIWAVDGGFAASDGSGVFFSDTGMSWTPVSSGGTEDRGIIALGRGPGGYLAIAEHGRTVLASDDGLTWRKVAVAAGDSGEPTLGWSDLVPIGSGWIAIGEWSIRLPSSQVSADGAVWTGVTPVPGMIIMGPVAVGPNLVLAQWWMTSPNGRELPGGTVEIRLLGD